MNKYFLNETSLIGQYESVDDFIRSNRALMECIHLVKEHGATIYKKSNFYDAKITNDENLYCLSKYRSNEGEINDLLRKFKYLLELACNNPYWDYEGIVDDSECLVDGNDCTGTVIAAAAASEGALFSFSSSDYTDKCLNALYNGHKTLVYSIFSPYMHSEYLMISSALTMDEIIKHRYKGTKLDFSKLDTKYGFSEFESYEIKDCISTFDRFIKMEWDQIYQDHSLCYKDYQAPRSKNWFAGSEFSSKEIIKFRCVNPKRCYGYRDGDTFYALRMERDHSISDNG